MTHEKKILMVAPYGFNERMRNYVEFVNARFLAKNKWRVYALAKSDNKRNSYSYIGGEIHAWHYKNLVSGLSYLFKIFIVEKPRIVHIVTLRNNRIGIVASMLTKLFRHKLVCTEYGLLHDHYLIQNRDNPLGEKINPDKLIRTMKQIFGTGTLWSNIKNYLFHWPLTHADKVAFVSTHNIPIAKNLKLQNIEILPYIFDGHRWEDIPTAINTRQATTQNEATFQKIKNIAKNQYTLFVGQLKLRKGWDTLLEAIALVDKKIMPYFVFVTPTDPKGASDFFKLVGELNVSDRIFFLTQIRNRELKKLYTNSRIVIVPSRYEGFGLATIEGMEAKKPIIASDIPAINEYTKNEYNGLLFQSENYKQLAICIKRIVTDNALAKRLIAGGNETIKRLGSVKEQNKWLTLYSKLLD